jgi:hypothetical protein
MQSTVALSVRIFSENQVRKQYLLRVRLLNSNMMSSRRNPEFWMRVETFVSRKSNSNADSLGCTICIARTMMGITCVSFGNAKISAPFYSVLSYPPLTKKIAII